MSCDHLKLGRSAQDKEVSRDDADTDATDCFMHIIPTAVDGMYNI